MNQKQKRFVKEYLVDLNGSAAAIRAGYSENRARQTAYDLLSDPEVEAAIQTAFRERSRRTLIDQDQVVLELSRIAFANMGFYATWKNQDFTLTDSENLTPDQKAAVQEIIWTETGNGVNCRIKLADKLSALEKLGRHLGMFSEKVKTLTPDEVIILTEFAEDKIDVTEAATRYALLGVQLPEVLRVQLAKMEPPEPDAGDEGVYTDEELEADFQAMAAKVDEEKGRWLPERRAAVAQLKRDLNGGEEGAGGDVR